MTTFSRIQFVIFQLLLCFFLIQSPTAYSQGESKTIRLGEATTITFPSEPSVFTGPRQDQFVVNDENGSFQGRLLKANIDLRFQYQPLEKIKRIYLEYLTGMADGMNGKIVSVKYATLKGYVCVDAVIDYIDQTTQIPMRAKSRSVAIFGRIYNVNYINQTSIFDDHEEVCDEFLNSLQVVSKPKGTLKDPGGPFYEKEAKTPGEMAWRMFIFVFIVVCITIVAVYFGTRKSKRERANQTKNL